MKAKCVNSVIPNLNKYEEVFSVGARKKAKVIFDEMEY